MTTTLATQPRDPKANLDTLRSQDMIPAVYYGQGSEAVSITVNRQEMIRMYREAGTATIIDLETTDGVKKVLIHDIAIHPVLHTLLHVDFLVVDMTKAVTLTVPLEFIGEAPAEKNGLGVLNRPTREVEIEVAAADIPSHIDVDVSVLATLDDAIYVSDLGLPASAKLITDETQLVANVSEQKEEVEEESTMDLDSIESETGNKEQEGEEEKEG